MQILKKADTKQPVFRRETCRLCESKDLEMVLHLEPTPCGDAYVTAEKIKNKQELYPLDVVLCKDCGHVQLYDVVNPDLLYGNYIYTTSISLGLSEHFKKYADEAVILVKPVKDPLVVDIGSNDGTLLKYFKSNGMRVLGVDPAPYASAKAIKDGIETLQTIFTVDLARKIKNQYGEASIITANNVFANIDDLKEIIEGMRQLLSADGVFIFETGYLLDLVTKRIIDNIYHEHISYYAVKPLRAFFEQFDMELFDVKHSESKGGSFRGFVQFKKGPHRLNPFVNQLIDYEVKSGIDNPGVFKSITSEIDGAKKQLNDKLIDLKKQNKIIAGYGASVGVTTLIYLFGIAGDLSFLADDNPVRYNLFSPGYHIPVLPSVALYERKPDYCIIFAWRYAEAIMKKHKKFLEDGGHFILPLPKIEII